jgi:hypothetical protein
MLFMKITDGLITEHRVFGAMFDYLERVLPDIDSLAEIQRLVGLIETLLRWHADVEENYVLIVLAYMLADRGQFDLLYDDELHEMDNRWQKVRAAQSPEEARRDFRTAMLFSRAHFAGEERRAFPLLEHELQTETLSTLASAWAVARGVAEPEALVSAA